MNHIDPSKSSSTSPPEVGVTDSRQNPSHNEIVFEYNVTKNFLKEALELGLSQASILLSDREQALRAAIEKPKKAA